MIHKDQVCFELCRQGRDNTPRAIDLVEKLNRRSDTVLLFSLNAKKAFDRLNGCFMFEVLRSFIFKGPFVKALKNLY